MSALADAAKGALLVFAVVVVQLTVVAPLELFGAHPDLLLVTRVAIALLRGSVYGATCGFFAGLLVDTATLDTLGLSSLVLTVAGYWIGRYGETTGRDRGHAPLLSVVVATVGYAFGALGLHFVLGDSVSARYVLLETLPQTILLNLALTPLVYAVCRRWLTPPQTAERVPLVRLLG